jgi:hypothetical protein
MRLIAARLTLEIVSAGCATTAGRNAGVVCAIGSTILAGTIIRSRNQAPSDSEAPPAAVYVVAAAIVIALVSGGIAIGAEVTAPEPIEPLPSGAPHTCDLRAELLTRDAQHAARLGQCSAVRSFGQRVREIDPGCYAVEFVAIRCSTTP